jgi:hypothetical protein
MEGKSTTYIQEAPRDLRVRLKLWHLVPEHKCDVLQELARQVQVQVAPKQGSMKEVLSARCTRM